MTHVRQQPRKRTWHHPTNNQLNRKSKVRNNPKSDRKKRNKESLIYINVVRTTPPKDWSSFVFASFNSGVASAWSNSSLFLIFVSSWSRETPKSPFRESWLVNFYQLQLHAHTVESASLQFLHAHTVESASLQFFYDRRNPIVTTDILTSSTIITCSEIQPS